MPRETTHRADRQSAQKSPIEGWTNLKRLAFGLLAAILFVPVITSFAFMYASAYMQLGTPSEAMRPDKKLFLLMIVVITAAVAVDIKLGWPKLYGFVEFLFSVFACWVILDERLSTNSIANLALLGGAMYVMGRGLQNWLGDAVKVVNGPRGFFWGLRQQIRSERDVDGDVSSEAVLKDAARFEDTPKAVRLPEAAPEWFREYLFLNDLMPFEQKMQVLDARLDEAERSLAELRTTRTYFPE